MLPLAITYQAPYCASLYWEVQALAGVGHVNVAAYREDWGIQPGDEAMLEVFRKLRRDYQGALPRRAARENPYLPMPPLGDTAVDTRFQNCFLAVSTMDQAWARVDGLLAEPDARTLRRVMAHFEPRFKVKFQQMGYLAAYRASFERYARTSGLESWLVRSAKFYGVPDEASLAPKVTFVYTPPARGTNALHIGSNTVVEVVPGEQPVQRVDVVAHELAHYLYAEGRLEDDPAFIQAFYAAAGAEAGPAMGLVNEGLATAIGQGAVQEALSPASFAKDLARPKGFYNEFEIDAYSKAIFPAVKQALLGGRPVRELVPELVAGYRKAFAALPATAPRVLTNYMLVLDERHDPAFAAYFKAVPPRSIYNESVADGGAFWSKYRGLPGLVAILPEDLADLALHAGEYGLSPDELARLRQPGSGLLHKPRATGGDLFVVVAPDRASLGAALAKFAGLSSLEPGWTSL